MTTHLDDTQGLDELLENLAFKCAGGITDNGAKEYLPAKQAILHWVATEIIGANQPENYYRTVKQDGQAITDCSSQSHNWSRNTLRKEQRAKLALYGYKQNTKEVTE